MEKTRDVRSVTQLAGKCEWFFVGHPSGGLWLELTKQVRPYVKIARAGTSEQQLHRTAGRKINLQVFHAKRHSAGGLVSVEYNHRAHLMSSLGDRLGVLQEGAFEKHVRDRDQQRFFIDRGQHSFQRYGDAVVRLNSF